MTKAENLLRAAQSERPDLINQIRDRIVSTEDTVCIERARLAAEAYEIWLSEISRGVQELSSTEVSPRTSANKVGA